MVVYHGLNRVNEGLLITYKTKHCSLGLTHHPKFYCILQVVTQDLLSITKLDLANEAGYYLKPHYLVFCIFLSLHLPLQ